jgi:hypothetical protein
MEGTTSDLYTPLEYKSYDIAGGCDGCCCIKQKLNMGDQQLVWKVRTPCTTTTKRRPYAELGEVAILETPCGSKITSEMIGLPDENGNAPGWTPGNCCAMCSNQAYVREIFDDIENRKALRGHAAQSAKLDGLLSQVAGLRTNLQTLANSTEAYTEAVPLDDLNEWVQMAPLPNTSFDVRNCCEIYHPLPALMGLYSKLDLEGEGIVFKTGTCCNGIERKREYANMGFVKRSKQCVCCRQVSWEAQTIMPGCCCANKKITSEIQQALRERMIRRGTIGQFRKQTVLVPQLEEALRALDAVVGASGSDRVRAPSGVDVQVMDRQYSTFEDKEFDMTNTIESVLGCCLTCGVQGFATETMKLDADMLTYVEKDNLDTSTLEMSYAQLDSIDVEKSCCCYYTINNESPGFGCDRGKVEEVSAELQKRTFERGNVAQLSQLEHLLAVANAIEQHATVLAKEASISATSVAAPHKEVVEEFELKEYDFSDPCESLGNCCASNGLTGPKTTRTLKLHPEMMELTVENWMTKKTSRMPYASLDGVDIDSTCGGMCVEADDIGSGCMGFGTEEVKQIVEELKPRIEKRGNIAQLKLQDNIIAQVRQVAATVEQLKASKGL